MSASRILFSVNLTAFALLQAASTAVAQEGRPRFVPPVSSPEVNAENEVSFRIRAGSAEEIRVTGNDMPEIGQGQAMVKGDDDVWELKLGPVQPGSYRYHFNVDGVEVNDPANASVSQSQGNTWSLVHVPGASWMDANRVPHGAVAEVTYFSKSLDRFRRMHVYTPPGYEANGQTTYPVFYLLHGAFDCDDSWSSVGRAGFILDNLIAAGNAAEMIVVMPAGHTGPFRMGRDGPRVDEFTQDFVEDIAPYIEANYRVKNGREHRAIAGLSMGGAQTLNIAMKHLDHFAYIGVFSSGVFGITGQGPGGERRPSWEEVYKEELANDELKQGLALFWFATGKDDFLIDTSRATVDMLKNHDFDVVYKETEGGHTWINWREYLYEFSQYLFRDNVVLVPLEGNQEVSEPDTI